MMQAAVTSALGNFRVTLPDIDPEYVFEGYTLPANVPFALIWSPHYKPVAFPTIEALAASIHRRRRGQAIELFSTRVPRGWQTNLVRVVRVTSLHENMPNRSIGCAWLGGSRQSQRELRAALRAVESRFGGGR